MSKSVSIILSVVIFSHLPAFGEALNKTCPVSGEEVDEDETSTITIGTCCSGSKKKVDADPRQYLTRISGK